MQGSEPWYGIISGVISGAVGAVGFGWWSGRNVVTKADLDSSVRAIYEQVKSIRDELSVELKSMEETARNDRHSSRSNMDQRSEQFQEKVDDMRNRYDALIDKIHNVSTAVTRIETAVNGKR